MKHQKEREQIVEYGKKLITEKLTTGTGATLVSTCLKKKPC